MTSTLPAIRVVEAVGALRGLDFFGGRIGSDTDVAATVIDDYRATWGHDPVDDEPLLDLELLRFDPGRVWWEDTEADVGPGNDAYVAAIEGWAAISRGVLHPEQVAEVWDSPRGTVRIDVTQDGDTHGIEARDLGDYLDMQVLEGLNAIIGASPLRFRMHSAFDQTAFVIVCDEGERRLLEERGWSFATW